MDAIPQNWSILGLGAVGSLLLFAFGFLYFIRSVTLSHTLKRFARGLEPLRNHASDPHRVEAADEHLDHLWKEYCETLHAEKSVDENGLETISRYRATLPACAVFHSGAVIDGRLSVEFFKHLPGLLTGLGIIGTFSGLIAGLQQANSSGGLDTQVLITSVGDAFIFSASAIAFAMLVTFLEKWRYARLLHITDELCRVIDRLYSTGVGEEYLHRLVVASEQAVTNSQQLKDSLVGELGNILERLTKKQIEAAERHSAELRTSLQQPIEAVAQGFSEFGRSQGQAIGAGLQDQMAAFAEKLDQLLGGQVGQAKELQAETVRALQTAVATFQGMAQSVSAVGENATIAMSTQLRQAIDDMAERQGRMNETMRAFLDEMRGNAERSQSGTQQHLAEMLQGLKAQMSGTIDVLRHQADASGEATRTHQQQISEEARRTIEGLAGEVRSQTQAIEQATSAMRGAIADLGASTARNVQAVGDSAERMSTAADEFTRTGLGLSDMFQKTGTVTGHMTQIAEVLRKASTHIDETVADYREAREDFQKLVTTLRETVANAQKDASMTEQTVSKIGQAADKLRQAQDAADAYLEKLNEVLAKAHEHFSTHMLETVKRANATFHQELTRSTQLISNVAGELDDALSQIVARPQ
jgi:hypothetical protein